MEQDQSTGWGGRPGILRAALTGLTGAGDTLGGVEMGKQTKKKERGSAPWSGLPGWAVQSCFSTRTDRETGGTFSSTIKPSSPGLWSRTSLRVVNSYTSVSSGPGS